MPAKIKAPSNKPSLADIIKDLRWKAFNHQGVAQSITLSHGLTVTVRCLNPHYWLTLARKDVYPSPREWSVVRGCWGKCDDVPETGKQIEEGTNKVLYAEFHLKTNPEPV